MLSMVGETIHKPVVARDGTACRAVLAYTAPERYSLAILSENGDAVMGTELIAVGYRDALRAADAWLTRWGFEQREVA